MIPIPSGRLATALNLDRRELLALVGGGGKSTLLFQLAQTMNRRTIVTTTTKMGEHQTGNLDVIEAPFEQPLASWNGSSPVFVRSGVKGHKSIGVPPSVCDEWFSDDSLCDFVLVEADGARHRPFKAPANFEPVLPVQTTTVLSVIGADALGRVIADQCHRPLRVAAVAGCSPYERLTPARAATVLSSPHGSFKGCPADARKVVVITKVPLQEEDQTTFHLVEELVDALTSSHEVVLIEFEQVK